MWVKKLRQRKLQSFLIFLIAMMSSLLLASSLEIILSLNKPFENLVKECKSPAVRVFPFVSDDKTIEELKNGFKKLKDFDKFEEVERHYLQEKVTFKGDILDGFLNFALYNNKVHENIRYIGEKGNGPKEGQCYITAALSNKYNIQVGEEIEITKGNEVIKYVVDKIYTDPFSTNLAFDSEIIIKDMPEGYDINRVLLVYTKEGVSGRTITSQYRKNNDGVIPGRVIAGEEVISNSTLTEKIMGGIFLAAGIIVLLISCMMIRFMIKNALLTDKKNIAIYKTIGYSSRQVLSMYMKLYLCLVLLGTTVGCILSILVSNIFLKQAFSNIGESKGAGYTIPMIITFTIIVISVMFHVYRVVSKMNKVKPIEAFSERDNDLNLKKNKKNVFGKLSFSPWCMALRSIVRDKKNTMYIIITCIVAIFGVNFSMAAMGTLTTINEHNDYWLGFDASDVMVEVMNVGCYEEIYKALLEDNRVNKVIKNTYDMGINLKWHEGMGDPVISTYTYETYHEIKADTLEGRNPKYSDEVAVTEILLKETGKEVGDYLEVYLNKNTKIQLLITGTYQSIYDLGRNIRMLGSTFMEKEIDVPYDEFTVYLEDKVNKEKFIEEYSQKYKEDSTFIKRSEKFVNIMQMITEPQEAALKPFMILVMLIGAINIFSIILLKNLYEKRKNAIYKSIGYDSKHLTKSNLYYVGIIAFVSILITVPVFIVTFPKIMVLALSMFGFKKYPVYYSPMLMIAGNMGVFLLFLISAFISSRSLKKVDVRELIEE